jgi:hypothetical protein
MVAMKTVGLLSKLPIPRFDNDRWSCGQDSGEGICCE